MADTRIPRWLLTQQGTLEQFTGHTGHGPTWADPVPVRGRLEPSARQLRSKDVAVLSLRATWFQDPQDGGLPVESRLTVQGETYRVVQVDTLNDPAGRPNHLEVMLA